MSHTSAETATPVACPDHVAQALMVMTPSAPRAKAVATTAARPVPSGERTLMVLGLPVAYFDSARETLSHWANQGRRWVGVSSDWHIEPVSATDPHLGEMLASHKRWALWVGTDEEAFRRAWRLLMTLAEQGGPQQLLLIHPSQLTRPGLLENLQHAAAQFLQRELVVLA